MRDLFKLGLFLMLTCAIAAAALTGAHLYTSPRIEAQKEAELQAALKEVLPRAAKYTQEETFFTGYCYGKKVGYIFLVSPSGYTEPIEMMVGINDEGKVTGVKILYHLETPGLGSKITKNEFLEQFKGKSKRDRLKVKQDIQAITGATISSNAVTSGIKEALEMFAQIRR